jgi:Ca2+-transporting ATPase
MMRSLRAVSELFPQAREAGLIDANVADSRARFGANRLTPLPKEPIWKKFVEKFDEPIIKILLAASLLKIVVDLFDASTVTGAIALTTLVAVLIAALVAKIGGWIPSILFALAFVLVIVSIAIGNPSYEGLAVMIAVFLATGVAFFSEFRSDKEFEKLNATKDSVRVKVERNGGVQTIALEEVVVGDLVLLETGDEIPADARIVKANDLWIDQSLMTGESEPVKKVPARADDTSDAPEEPGCVFRGTQVVDGVGQLVVTNVGDDTMIGQIARRLSGEPEETPHTVATDDKSPSRENRIHNKLSISKNLTPLQEKLEVLAGLISKIGYAAAIAIFVALLVHGLWNGEVRLPNSGEDGRKIWLANVKALLAYFVYMVIIIVVAVPEGLPMSVTVSLAIAWRKMSKANSLVRQLVACETVGSATVICTDKTGTLTQNKMTVSRIGLAGKTYEKSLAESGMSSSNSPLPGTPLHWLIINAAVNSTASLELKNGKVMTVGNSTEGALLNWLNAGAWIRSESGFNYVELRTLYPVLYQVHFTSDRKRMTSVVKVEDRAVTLVKGAPEAIVTQCERYLASDGTIRDLTEVVRAGILAQIATAAGDAMRTLAFAHVEFGQDFPLESESIHLLRQGAAFTAPGAKKHIHDPIERDLIYTGFVAIRDPLREDVKEAMKMCRQAGIEVKMITGDTIETARAIGREIGLIDSPEALALTSAEFNALCDDEVKSRLAHIRILARALPKDKYRLVGLLQEQHHVVAMTGDGTNDAPALKRADVGLAMGIAGTEVAKEASKIVLLDDSFNTIVRAVQWGRALYENIQRFIQFQLTINLSALTIAFLGPFLGLKPPFTVLQLLWINVIMDTFAAIALCSEPPRENLMRKSPKRRDENILTREMLGNIFITGVFFVVVMIGLLLVMQTSSFKLTEQVIATLRSDQIPEAVLEKLEPLKNKDFSKENLEKELAYTLNADEQKKWEEHILKAAGMAHQGWLAGNSDYARGFPFTMRQVTIFFTVYVFFQVWNQINCRSLSPEESGLHRLFENPQFLIIASLTVLGQLLIVTFGGQVFNVEPLDWEDWVVIAASTASVLIFAEFARQIRILISSGSPAAAN